ncbi:MAG: uracil-DNA glycosylase, partial [Alphaproteobacteria bacterium]|nr:uracil-DNA glycosylase [Alphaproteobacteria bacterium]
MAPAHEAYHEAPPATLEAVRSSVEACRRCDLWRCGAGVAGEGPAEARLMLVGEQPGDLEEQAQKPFIGPAGKMLDKALEEAGVPRGETFV